MIYRYMIDEEESSNKNIIKESVTTNDTKVVTEENDLIPINDPSNSEENTPNEEESVPANNTNMLVILNSLLRIYCSNFSVLHWNSVGEEFNDAHRNIAEEYEELCHKYVDVTAEMATRLGINPLNYIEIIDLFNNCDRKYIIVDSKRLYTRKDIIIIADRMFTDIVELISATIESEELKAPINAGIRSELESILNDFDLQYRYINKRRLLETSATNESTIISESNNDNSEYSKRKKELLEVNKIARSLLSSYKSKGLRTGIGFALKSLTEKDKKQIGNDTAFNYMKENLNKRLEDFYNGEDDYITVITGDLRTITYGSNDDEKIDNIPDKQFREEINKSWDIVDNFFNELKKLVSNNKNISGSIEMDGDKYEFQIDYYA